MPASTEQCAVVLPTSAAANDGQGRSCAGMRAGGAPSIARRAASGLRATRTQRVQCEAASMQFIKGIEEPCVPEVKLTRARDGSTGTGVPLAPAARLPVSAAAAARDRVPGVSYGASVTSSAAHGRRGTSPRLAVGALPPRRACPPVFALRHRQMPRAAVPVTYGPLQSGGAAR